MAIASHNFVDDCLKDLQAIINKNNNNNNNNNNDDDDDDDDDG